MRCDIYDTFWWVFLVIFSTLSPIRTGNIQVLESCPNLTSVNFYCCKNIEGEHTSNELS